MKTTGVKVHMALDRVMADFLCQIDKSYYAFRRKDGSIVVELDKALYGCVEASKLWYDDLTGKLASNGFTPNQTDSCVFNKSVNGVQITIVVHVDDLLVTSKDSALLEAFDDFLQSVYPETKTKHGTIVNYIGMTFDFSIEGEVQITMRNCVNDILKDCGVTHTKRTPAAATLFEVRDDAKKATADEMQFFRSYVAKILYLAKRARPECLTAVAFLTTRAHCCDEDDMAKLRRLLGYLLGTSNRGIVLRAGSEITVKAYIDAAYGVHTSSGKSHTGCAIVLGEAGTVFAKSTKQRIVTKSSTEAELVGLSDTATQAIHLRNFLIAQGYKTGPAIIYQDNLSCMSLVKRGGPTSERSRHIGIRYFWVKERVDTGEITIEHLSTEKMFANVLTKPLQGAQFISERSGLTNWI